jgi:hypothetical protein
MARLIGALILSFTLVVPCLAEAACVWVLWGTLPTTSEPTGFIYRIREAFEKKAECDAAKTKLDRERLDEFMRSEESGTPLPPSSWAYLCLPDTIDPRGAKGGS